MGLISRGRRDEEFTTFVNAHSGALLRTALFLTGDRHDAEDLLQTTLTKTYVAWGSARGDHAHAYARRVMITTHTDTWRRRRWREQTTDHHDLTAGAGTGSGIGTGTPGSDPATAAASADGLRRALAVLTPRERAVVVLRYCEDLTEQQTARLLHVSVGTVKTLHSRAMAKLRPHPPAPARSASSPSTATPAAAVVLTSPEAVRVQH